MAKFFGKYRGKVVANTDPLNLGRVQVTVPAVLENGTPWAMPSVPYAGKGVGLYLIPPEQANVWVEFEAGDTEFPIWSGCFWSDGEVPGDTVEPTRRTFKCDGVDLQIDDQNGGSVTLKVTAPIANGDITVVIDSSGAVIKAGSMGKVEITASQVAINDDGLVVR